MINMTVIKKGAFAIGRQFAKYAPQILLTTGIVAGGVGVVLACKETIAAQDILEEHEAKRNEIAEMPIVDSDKRKDICKLYVETAGKLAKNYAGSALFLGGSGLCILSAFKIVDKRLGAAVSLAAALAKSKDELKARLVEAVGEDKAKDIFLGNKKEDVKVDTVDENGEVKTKTVKNAKVSTINDPSYISPYAKFFDELNDNWTKDPEHNKNWLLTVQSQMNDLFHSRGHLYLNEVYDALGIPRTKEGQIVGWLEGLGDDYVDFGLFDIRRSSCREFVNGLYDSVLLDFNVDGIIWDKV